MTHTPVFFGVFGDDWLPITQELITACHAQGVSFSDPNGGPPPDPRHVFQMIESQVDGAAIFSSLSEAPADEMERAFEGVATADAFRLFARPVIVVGGLLSRDLVRAFEDGVRWIAGADCHTVLVSSAASAKSFALPQVLSDVYTVAADESPAEVARQALAGFKPSR